MKLGVAGPNATSTLPFGGRERGRYYVLMALVLFGAIFTIGAQSWVRFFLDPKESNGVPVRLFTNADYPGISIGSRMVAAGRGAELYNFDAQLQEQGRIIEEGYLYLRAGPDVPLLYPYPYAPFIAVLWSPFAGLSPLTGMAIWDILNIAALAGGLWYLVSSLPLPGTTRLLALLAGLTSFPFIVNLEQGQSSGVVLFSFALGIGLLRRGHDLPAGLAFGLLILKMQWLPILVLVLLFKRRWRTLSGMAITGCALLLTVVAVIGTGWIPGYLRVVQGAQNWERELALDPWFSHSLSGGVTALLGRGTDDIVKVVMIAATLLAAALLIYLWRGPWRPGTALWDGLMAITLLAIIFTNLQVNTHDLCLLSMPAALGISYLHQSPKGEGVKMAWYALLWGSYLVPALLLPQTFALPLRMTTLLVAGMIGLLVWLLSRHVPSENAATTAQ
ncbi:MAG TPA: glycosyltransferase family 87 protein [Chloroflexia bacterium]